MAKTFEEYVSTGTQIGMSISLLEDKIERMQSEVANFQIILDALKDECLEATGEELEGYI